MEDTIIVLLVDDEPAFLDQAEIYLVKENERLDVNAVISPEKALRLLEGENFDVIVSDYQMPDMDGLEFLETIREERGLDIPFIMFTGKGREEVAMKALNLGADRYLQKGGDPRSQYGVLAQAIAQEARHYKTERSLKRKNDILEQIFEKSEEGFYIRELSGELTFVNDAFAEIHGYDSEELIGMRSRTLLTEESEKKVEGLDFDNLKDRWFEVEIVTKGGDKKNLRNALFPLKDEKGNMRKIFGISIDITEEKKKGEEIRTSEERYRRLFETAQDGMLIIDAETGKILDANPFIRDMLGYSLDELKGKELWEIGTFRDIVENREKFEKLKEKEYVRYEHLPLVTKNGTEKSVEFVSNLYMVGEDEIIQCNIRDITERKRTEKRFKKIFENLGDPVIIKTIGGKNDGRILEANQTMCELFGYSREELEGMNVYDDLISGEPEETSWNEIKEGLKEGSRTEFSVKKKKKDGSKVWMEVVAVPLRHKGEDAVLAVNRDITESKEKDQVLKRERKKFKEIFNNANDAMYLHELTEEGMPGRFVEVNETAVEMLGYGKEEFLEMSPKDIDAEEVAEELPKVMDKLIDKGEIKFEGIHKTKDGTKIPVEVHSYLFELEGKKRVLSIARDISERKESEKELKRSERKFRSIFEASPDPTFLLNKDGVFEDINQVALKKLGYSKEDVVGKSLEEVPFFSEKGLDKTREKFEKRKEGKDIPPYEIDILTKNGDKLIVEVNVRAFKEDGFKGEIVIGRDITERKKAEKKLRESERRYDLALKGAGLGVWDWDVRTDEVKYSEQWAKILGYSPDEIEQDLESWEKRVHPNERSRVKEELQKHLDDETDIFKTEHRMKTKSGDWVWVKDVGKVFERDENDEPVRATGILEDITDRKEVEEELKESEEKYKELSEELENILDHIPGLVYYKDTENNFIKVNKKLAEAHGMSKEEMEGKSLFDLYPKEEAQKYLEDDKDVIENREPKLNMIEPWSPDEEEWISTSKIPYLVDGEVKGIIGISIDVTEKKKNRERVELLHTILRHDIKNKIQVVHGYLQLLEDQKLPEEVEDFLKKALKGSKESMNLLDKIRLLLKAQEEVKKAIKIADTLYDAVEGSESLANERDMEISVQCTSTGCEVEGGPLLKEVFSNIIENSVYHSEGNEIKVSGEIKEDEVICTIEDDGKGIPDDKKDTIFEKGYTTDEKRGTGLGLFLVNILIDTYGGKIDVKDSELGGARFDIRLRRV
ncbi:MAG: PAS domain S-box protein [Thermoplasmata archaeon]